ncbi:MAG TPA: dTDP-4-dehydrorhamnose 3,5-epimerase [Burkholderiales bacterium]|nr:dTDP-4-dehydrorhamnose 3,5-epimerase [Burkholderiales bacterium]
MIKGADTAVAGVVTLAPDVHEDERGFFLESYNERNFADAMGVAPRFVQDNHSHSVRNVLRGLHYQIERPQGKLVRAVSGEIYDVAVDLRRSSPTFGRWTAARLSAQNKHMQWIPEGCAHGFLVLSETADVLYKTTTYWAPEFEHVIRWNDPQLAIPWPLAGEPLVSSKDAQAGPFSDAELYP